MGRFHNIPAYTATPQDERFTKVYCADSGVCLGDLSDIDTHYITGERIVESDNDGYRVWRPLVNKPAASEPYTIDEVNVPSQHERHLMKASLLAFKEKIADACEKDQGKREGEVGTIGHATQVEISTLIAKMARAFPPA
jgi:hypothetical protein